MDGVSLIDPSILLRIEDYPDREVVRERIAATARRTLRSWRYTYALTVAWSGYTRFGFGRYQWEAPSTQR